MTAIDLLGLDEEKVWTTELAFQHLSALLGAESKRTTERRLHSLEILPQELNAQTLVDELGRPAIALVTNWVIERARSKRRLLLFSQLASLPGGRPCLHANDARGGRYWVPLPGDADARMVRHALAQLQQHLGRDLTVLASGQLVGLLRDMPSIPSIEFVPQAYSPILIEPADDGASRGLISPHLKRLENESIHILREAIAEAQNPVMMYSVGKDSGVMLHLARKAFYPSQPPFPLLHIDTRWKFQEMYLFRDYMARRSGMRLITHINPEAITKNINPFEHGAARHTEITKTEGLKQALDHYKFDVVIGGARRDEEKSRAKERVFSFRTATHVWDPKNQRPELWNLYNARKNAGESIRVFPLSNWTELDIWQYIRQENIPVVPLYFAQPRPVVVRPDMIMMVNDDRCQIMPDEQIEIRKIRFRTLGCYPLTGAIESEAETIDDILLELINANTSERQGRKIDTDSPGSMEKKKQVGYF